MDPKRPATVDAWHVTCLREAQGRRVDSLRRLVHCWRSSHEGEGEGHAQERCRKRAGGRRGGPLPVVRALPRERAGCRSDGRGVPVRRAVRGQSERSAGVQGPRGGAAVQLGAALSQGASSDGVRVLCGAGAGLLGLPPGDADPVGCAPFRDDSTGFRGTADVPAAGTGA